MHELMIIAIYSIYFTIIKSFECCTVIYMYLKVQYSYEYCTQYWSVKLIHLKSRLSIALLRLAIMKYATIW